MRIKPPFNVKITLNLITNFRKTKKSVVCNIFFILKKLHCVRMRDYVEIYYLTIVYYMI